VSGPRLDPGEDPTGDAISAQRQDALPLERQGLHGTRQLGGQERVERGRAALLSEGSIAKLTHTGDDAARPKEVNRATAELVTTNDQLVHRN
jgi:hypothetical protein